MKAYPVIHPYISGMTNLSFLSKLKKLGYDFVDVKGLRYDPTMDSWMLPTTQNQYKGTEGQEFLPEDGWRKKVQEASLKLKSLREWTEENQLSTPSLNKEEAEKRVKKLLKYANITSSDNNEAVIKSAIERRL